MDSTDKKRKKPGKSREFDPSKTVGFEGQLRPDFLFRGQETQYIHVEVVGGPMDGQNQRLPRTTFKIGRAPSNDLTLSLDPVVSGNHARIVQKGNSYFLEDLGSRNGTYIGDEKITGRRKIQPGTLFIVGQTFLEFMPR
jgi:pSer/pThr/pTyr-binding forkhead associated (FHA) protein